MAFFRSLTRQIQHSKQTMQTKNRWSIGPLEPRILLAGDAGAAVNSVPSGSDGAASIAEVGPAEIGKSEVQAGEIAFIAGDLDLSSDAVAGLRDGVELVMVPSDVDAIGVISRHLRGRSGVTAIHLVSHGGEGVIGLGRQPIDASQIVSHRDAIAAWQRSLTPGADLLIYGCDVASGHLGNHFVRLMSQASGMNVAASVDRTGACDVGGDWDLEFQVGVIDTPLVAHANVLQSIDVVLPITIRAAGTVGDEQMQLLIDGAVVQTWDNVGGDAYGGTLRTFTHDGPNVSANRVRVAFTNDLYEPVSGIDRNLRVDFITIGGRTFQTEDPSVFSTGTWLPADGIQPGSRRNEFLHTNGYFQFADTSTPPTPTPTPTPPTATGGTVEIFAAGQEGSESMELWLSGQRVQTWTNVGGDVGSRQFVSYRYTASQTIAPENVQVRFTNDAWDPANNLDRNLFVDRIVVSGQTIQTESPGVLSTGTWQPSGVVPGFFETELLSVNGYFQFASAPTTTPPVTPPPAASPGSISLATGAVTVNEADGAVEVLVRRTGGSDGRVTVDFTTQSASAVAGEDFVASSGTLVFADGQTSRTIRIPIRSDSRAESDERFSVTIDNVTGGATLLAPRTTNVTIVERQTSLPNYASFASAAGLSLQGSAVVTAGVLELTADVGNQAGTAFHNSPINLSANGSFRSAFQFQIQGGGDGADGLTFVIQNDPRGAAAIGVGGGDLGYSGITRSVAVEFDTFRNFEFEANDNHVSILNGAIDRAIITARPAFDLNGGQTVFAWVDYNGASDALALFLSTGATKPQVATLQATIDLQQLVGDSAFVGFTAATGGLTNRHIVTSWTLDQEAPTSPPVQPVVTIGSRDVVTGLRLPTAVDWLPDGTMLIAEKSGIVRTAIGGSVSGTPFVDISRIVNDTRDRGLLDIAIHPDFPNQPYVYVLFTHDPPEVFSQAAGTLAGPDGNGNRAGQLIRVTADAATGYRTAVAGSEVVLLGTNSTWNNFNGFANSTNDFAERPAGELPGGGYLRDFINSDSESHTVGSLAFGTDGALFVSIGDGASYNRVDIRADRVQDVDSLSGKVLRIDPITGRGLADNPFYNGDAGANRSKVYQLGLRNPFRISVDSQTGQLYVGDVGWFRWEEINAAGPGANFGWPFYEGGRDELVVNGNYLGTPEADAFFASGVATELPAFALSHQADGINAIVLGDVYRGNQYGGNFNGRLFFNDLGQGIVRSASVDASGRISGAQTFATGAGVVVAITEGPDGFLYYVDLDDNRVGRWEVV